MPELQHDHFALVLRQLGETAHGLSFHGGFARQTLEPATGLEFATEPGPQAAAVVQRPVSEGPHAVVQRLVRWCVQRKQRDKCLLHNILGLAMRQSKRTAIEDQFGRFLFIQDLAPGLIQLFVGFQVLTSGHRRAVNLYTFLGEIFRNRGLNGS